MKKVSIIGANSYIARNLYYSLTHSDTTYEIFLYDYEPEHLDGGKNYQQIHILEEDGLSNVNLSCDVVYMFVGKTGSANGFEDYNLFIDVNERALLNLLNEYRKQKSHSRIIFPSSRLVYKGMKGELTEDAEKEFKTIYAMNKFACEQYLEQYHRVFGVQYCILRICIPYGTMVLNASSYGTAEFMLSKAVKGENISLYGDGAVRRTLTYMKDLCESMIQASFADKCANDVFNVGGENYSLKEMAELIAQKYHVGIDHVPWPEVAFKIESGDTVFNADKLKKIIGNTTTNKFADWIDEK